MKYRNGIGFVICVMIGILLYEAASAFIPFYIKHSIPDRSLTQFVFSRDSLKALEEVERARRSLAAVRADTVSINSPIHVSIGQHSDKCPNCRKKLIKGCVYSSGWSKWRCPKCIYSIMRGPK